MMSSWLFRRRGPSGFSWASTAEEVTAIVTGLQRQSVRDAILAALDLTELDLSSMDSVRTFASPSTSSWVMATPFSLSKDGIELQFATNRVGHFLLTLLLLETMKKTSRESNVEGRIVNVSSERHRFAYQEGIRFAKINDESEYNIIGAYGQSKLANILHANELARRFKGEGVNTTANSLHPGAVITNLLCHHSILDATTCYVALHPQVKGVSGKYFSDSNVYEASEKANDMELAKRLWEYSIELIT